MSLLAIAQAALRRTNGDCEESEESALTPAGSGDNSHVSLLSQQTPLVEFPDPRTATLGRCSCCRFTAALSVVGLCGACTGTTLPSAAPVERGDDGATARLFAAAERALTGVIATSDDGELVGGEP